MGVVCVCVCVWGGGGGYYNSRRYRLVYNNYQHLYRINRHSFLMCLYHRSGTGKNYILNQLSSKKSIVWEFFIKFTVHPIYGKGALYHCVVCHRKEPL